MDITEQIKQAREDFLRMTKEERVDLFKEALADFYGFDTKEQDDDIQRTY
jgi:hypothetical protein